ncbi:MAG TPA: response regulator [Bacteroidia bacterium]|jgi:CheY-like chemotaxis protein|nr:response regulator [Bacteroidia bacterium]
MKKKLNCILLIEDNEFTNIFNQKLIKNLDIAEQVYVAESGTDGLDFLLNKGKYQLKEVNHPAPDVIFLDINMPGMNGWEFVEEYKENNSQNAMSSKIVMLTTSPNPDDEQKAKLITEIIAFKRKPLTKVIINEVMAEHFPDYI